MSKPEITMIALCIALTAGPSGAEGWSGRWYGVTFGYGSGTYGLGVSKLNQVGPPVDVEAALIGLRYTQQTEHGNTVRGLDAEVSTGPNGESPIDTFADDWACITGACNVSLKWLVTLRGRVGMLINPKTLAYGAAGLAVGRVEGGIWDSEQQGASTSTGFTAGVGFERMMRENLTVFGEANVTDLGTLEFGTDGFVQTFDGKGDFATVKFGVNYRF